jgi:hypothetical protein
MIWWNVWAWSDQAWVHDPVVCVLAPDWWRARGLAADLLGVVIYDLHVGQHPMETDASTMRRITSEWLTRQAARSLDDMPLIGRAK